MARWRALPPAEKRLFLESLLVLWMARLALWLLPFRGIHRFVTRYEARKRKNSRARRLEPALIGRHITRAARLVPQGSCLTQGLAAQIVLARRGHPSTLRFGAKKAGGRFQAHAWVEVNGRIVVGGDPRNEYTDFRNP